MTALREVVDDSIAAQWITHSPAPILGVAPTVSGVRKMFWYTYVPAASGCRAGKRALNLITATWCLHCTTCNKLLGVICLFSLGECKSLILSIRGHQATVEQQVKFIIWKITAGLKKYIIVCMQKKKKKWLWNSVSTQRWEPEVLTHSNVKYIVSFILSVQKCLKYQKRCWGVLATQWLQARKSSE